MTTGGPITETDRANAVIGDFKTRFLVQTRPESERPCDRACEATTATDECKASDVFDTTGSHPRLLRQLR